MTDPLPQTTTPPTSEAIGVLVRHTLTVVAGLLVAHGFNEATTQGFVAALAPLLTAMAITCVTLAWSWLQKRIGAREKAVVVAIAQQLYHDSPDEVKPAPGLMAELPQATADKIVTPVV